MNNDNISNSSPNYKLNSPWALGSYNEIAIHFLPVSAHLVRLCYIMPTDHVLDVACGTGNTAITVRRMAGAKVVGIDITPELLIQAKEEAALAEVSNDIEFHEANAENLPFEDKSFDVVLSSFGHIHASQPEAAIKEMLRVTKTGGRIAFSSWPAELLNGKLFEVMAKHLLFLPSSFRSGPLLLPPSSSSSPPSPIQWGIPEEIEKFLGSNVEDIHFERGVVKKPVMSPNHYWKTSSTKGGPMIYAIQALKDPQKIESLRKDVLKAVTPYIHDNLLTLDYLITVAIKT